MPYCPHCGAQISANDRFCVSCGKSVANISPPSLEHTARSNENAKETFPTTSPRPRSWRKVGCGCLTALLVFVLLVFGAAMCATRDARQVARSHLDRIKAGKTDLSYQQLSPDAQAATAFEQYATLIAERPILREIETISFPEFERNNNTVTLKGRVRTAAGLNSRSRCV